MTRRRLGLIAGLGASTALAGLTLPAFGQQSILPPEIGRSTPAPAARDKPKDNRPREAAPRDSAAKNVRARTSGPGDEPRRAAGAAEDAGESSDAPVAAPALLPPPTAPVSPAVQRSRPARSDFAGDVVESSGLDTADEDAADGIGRVRRHDLPPGSRRSLARVGLISETDGGFATNAFGNAGGQYLAILMDNTDAPLVSRWASVLLRRALVSAVDTPGTINGADFVAARAALLTRMGEAALARDLVQSVDPDRATAKLYKTALDTFMANGDPGGLCPLTPGAIGAGADAHWQLARGMCLGLGGDAGTAGALIDRGRRQRGISAIDARFAEKVLGAGANGHRAVKIEWTGVDRLSPWSFGLATATGVDIPGPLMDGAGSRYRSWAALAPMTPQAARLAAAPQAAANGTLSARGYADLLAAAYGAEDRTEIATEQGGWLRDAYAAPTLGERMTAMKQIWDMATKAGAPYGGYVATAGAAAQLPPMAGLGADLEPLIVSMLTGGLDRNAADWARFVDAGSEAWALLAVGAPTALNNSDAGTIGRFQRIDDSADQRRSRMLLAGLAGLGRLDQDDTASVAKSLGIDLGASSDWSRAIDKAAGADQPGTVALLAAVGLQGSGWDKVNPVHLYHITAALRRVGLEAEARMIAAEAVARS